LSIMAKKSIIDEKEQHHDEHWESEQKADVNENEGVKRRRRCTSALCCDWLWVRENAFETTKNAPLNTHLLLNGSPNSMHRNMFATSDLYIWFQALSKHGNVEQSRRFRMPVQIKKISVVWGTGDPWCSNAEIEFHFGKCVYL
jgi:hypothetical protein